MGRSAWETFRALLEGRTIATRLRALLPTASVVDRVRVLGGIDIARHTASDPAIDLAEHAAREAMTMASIPHDHPIDTIIGSSKGAVHALQDAADIHCAPTLQRHALAMRGGLIRTVPDDVANAVALGPHGYLARHLQDRLKLSTVRCTVAACASSLTALHEARLTMLRTGLDRMLVLTSEAALLPVFIHSYQRLGVLQAQSNDSYPGKPLNAQRGGFMLSEFGAAVVLQRRAVNAAPPKASMELLGTASACDAFDMIRPTPGMPALRHIADELLGDQPIDLLHPHATGTPDHDPAELEALADALRNHGPLPPVYACKGALGHGLGAAGLVSLVLACLCARTGRVPPMPWIDQPLDSAFPIESRSAPPGRPLRTHAIFAAGFGGHTAGAVIRHNG